MCGRYTITQPQKALGRLVAAEFYDQNLVMRFNVAPSQKAHVVIMRDGGRFLTEMTWGLVPHWARAPSITTGHINARIESVDEKPSFRDSFLERRCLVPADGWYEWIVTPDGRRTMFVQRADSQPFAFAGLYSIVTSPTGEVLNTFTIITRAASTEIAVIHDRMPVILPADQYDAWINPAALSKENLHSILAHAECDGYHIQEVSSFVNNWRNQGERCVAPISQRPTTTALFE